MAQAVSSPFYTADIQGYSQDLVDGATYFKVLVTENGARQWFVGRRYTEFERLAEGLRLLLPGMPPMPPKSFFRRNFLPSFMSERQLALGNLLRHALRADPTLSRLPPLRQFLDAAMAPGGAAGSAQVQPAYSVPAYAQAAAPPVAPYATPAAQAMLAAPAHLAPQATPVMQGTPVAQAYYLPHEAPAQPAYPAYAAPPPAYAVPQPAYTAPQPAYAQAVPAQHVPAYAQPAYAQPAYAQPQPGYAQPGYAQPAYQQPGWSQPAYGQPAYGQPAYGQPAYGQPAYPQPGCTQPGYEQPYYEEQPSHSSGMGKVVGVGVAAGAAGLVGGMLLEGALESHRRNESDTMFRDGGFPALPGGPGFFGGPGLFGSEEVRTEVIDRDMFGRVEDVRETIVDRDEFGDVTREEVIVDDGW